MIMFKNAKEYFDENGCNPLGWNIRVKTNSRARESAGQAYKAMPPLVCCFLLAFLPSSVVLFSTATVPPARF